jgi:hypothetical protein
MQIKCFLGYINEDTFEKHITDFIKDKKSVDIDFHPAEGSDGIRYHAIIMYEDE